MVQNQASGKQAMQCPLCSGHSVAAYHSDKRRDYLQCSLCELVFVPFHQQLSRQDEKAIYDQHQNSAYDQGYREFLRRLTNPLLDQLKESSQGLDFGCGPGPTLSVMLEEQGHTMALFDLYYANDPAVLDRQYDFITSTEVIEHLAQPGAELQRLWNLLVTGGHLGLMTKQVRNRDAFANWHYKNDLTHISFFSEQTFVYLGQQWGSTPEFIGADVIIFRK
jgi:hypothetical protein